MVKNKKLDFTNQIIYVGLDVHKKLWYVTIIVNGMRVARFTMNPSPEGLRNYLVSHYPGGEYRSVYEAGFTGFWIDRKLRGMSINNIVVNPGDVPSRVKERIVRTDRIDSGKLVRELSVGHLEGLYIPDEGSEALRVLVRLRRQLVVDMVRQKNRIKSLLHYLGIELENKLLVQPWSKRYITKLRCLEMKHKETRLALDKLLDSLEYFQGQILSVVRELRVYVRGNELASKLVNLLTSVPGVGFVVAMILYSEIIDMRRFNTLDELVTYVGFAPAVRSSGEREQTMGIRKQHNKYLRNYLIEASWVAIRKDPALQMVYGKLKSRMRSQKAIIRISKKLLSRIRHVWLSEEPYIMSVVE